MLFDTHAHYHDKLFAPDREACLNRASENGVGYIITASENVATSIESISLSQRYDHVYAAIGVHPHEVGDVNNNVMSLLIDFASYQKVVAIGEIGLDYYYENSPKESQKIWFARQISLALSVNLPIIVHDRDAHEDTLSIIRTENAKKVGGVMHCFSGSVEMARDVLKNNLYISVGGPVTFKNSKRLVEVVKYVPDDMLLLETDCPYLSPEPLRGQRNESANLKYIAEKVAQIKGKSTEYIENITTENAKTLFRINN